MSDLNSILTELATVEKTAAFNLDDAPVPSRPAFEMAIRGANDQLVTLRKNYTEAVLGRAVGVFVLSDAPEQAKEFVDIVETEGGIAVNAEELYTRLSEGVDVAMGSNRVFDASSYYLLSVAIKDIAVDLGIGSILAPTDHSTPLLLTKADVVAHVRNIVRAVVGDELNYMYLRNAIADKAIGRRFVGSKLAVAVVGAGPAEAENLGTLFSGSSSAMIGSDTQVSAELVFSCFGLKSKKTKTTKNTNPQTT